MSSEGRVKEKYQHSAGDLLLSVGAGKDEILKTVSVLQQSSFAVKEASCSEGLFIYLFASLQWVMEQKLTCTEQQRVVIPLFHPFT